MVNFEAIQQSGITKLQEWRNRYGKSEYPEKVVINIFFDLFAIEGIWGELNSSFTGYKRVVDFNIAYQYVVNLKRSYQVQSLSPNLLQYLRQDKSACDTKYSDWAEDIQRAANGDNACVVEIEYSYWFYNQYIAATLMWAACGHLGLNKREAFQQVSGGDIGDFRVETFAEIIQSLSGVLGVSVGGYQDYQGNPVSSANIFSEGNSKYYPKNFSILPEFW